MNKSKLAIVCLALCIPLLHGCLSAVAAGGGAAVLMSEDRRSTGTIIDDQTVEVKVRNRINDKYDDQVHVDLASFNRFVLLVGEVPSQQIKDDIGTIALGVENVRNVQNELMIGSNPSASTRASDAYLTSKVKARFVSEHKFQANHVKVITENSVVYLMGLVRRQEADDAADIASTTGGVQTVVKVFEYL
jgi:osmotically-inducible protein OsmY